MQSKNDTKLNMGNGSSRSNLDNTWLNIYQSIKSKHDNAYTLIEEAISLEEQEKSQEVGSCNKIKCSYNQAVFFYKNISNENGYT